ncbi:hypothetical protein [Deinococcus soli (ex Cha et al. 2016)]|uniref:Uncharacterized protein n=2 Tax=Deinococcus soli (ex Cha et al. 2016) TaxID=1309411 RepID=A0ACC6KHJ7_9DEIO|nr:hypothetical protein [Deinococcus soli (ex Cha et al. 2016)]MDR6218787.1 hypothetical protein [Deinococcus soli (ex Cha et al. 2016)]MDR6328584.1 hypothetical protein [Deinococcus soli (ex Cha et al. 2016)]MDR6751929.1 hypothetical protein [Deinococcus soli (ex Cha et al. 2016)]
MTFTPETFKALSAYAHGTGAHPGAAILQYVRRQLTARTGTCPDHDQDAAWQFHGYSGSAPRPVQVPLTPDDHAKLQVLTRPGRTPADTLRDLLRAAPLP